MNAQVAVVCRPEVAGGFALAGLAPAVAGDAAAGEAAVERLLGREDLGVLLVEEAIYDALPVELRRRLGRRPLPMVVPFPGPAWRARPEGPESYVVEILRQAIGYRVRLR
jgi:vacuolar-type H+-ATPase subunit F/Vma7